MDYDNPYLSYAIGCCELFRKEFGLKELIIYLDKYTNLLKVILHVQELPFVVYDVEDDEDDEDDDRQPTREVDEVEIEGHLEGEA